MTDENPFPPGLFRKSIMCLTGTRNIKFTALTQQAHETWLTVFPDLKAKLTSRL